MTARPLPQPLEWLLRDRRTGEVTIAQVPNASLIVYLVTAVGRRLLHPSGTLGGVVDTVAGLALGWWALDEVIRGVNPFRRLLGAAVAAVLLVGLLRR